jgi:hypothetical protein
MKDKPASCAPDLPEFVRDDGAGYRRRLIVEVDVEMISGSLCSGASCA